MDPRASRKWWLSLALTAGMVALVWAVGTALAQGPDGDPPPIAGGGLSETWAFTYQGRLLEGGTPANGYYDFRVTIWDASTGGSQVTTAPMFFMNRYVEDGLFSLRLRPEAGMLSLVFDRPDRWIRVEVRPAGTTTWTALPRQPITPAPYAWSIYPGAVTQGAVGSPSAAISVSQTYDSASGSAFGIYGYGPDTGIYGTGGDYGVYGHADATNSIGVFGFGYGSGVRGNTFYGVGVRGYAVQGVGLRGHSDDGDLIDAYDTSPWDRRFRVTNGGNVFIDGDYYGAGGVWAGSADFAEMVLPGEEELTPGDVLVVGPDGHMIRCTEPYQTSVVGVFSTEPGFVGGYRTDEDGSPLDPGQIPLAVLGIVPARVSAEGGSIAPGDLLVTSATPGHAMRAGADPPVGTVVGKALESLEDGTGIILMLVVLQ